MIKFVLNEHTVHTPYNVMTESEAIVLFHSSRDDLLKTTLQNGSTANILKYDRT